ncbi:CPBP family intramembrane glutamic endopeptidase [Thalassotalea sp. PP2-459]|uniref:CPBP family intramembrane glutamic endopeptidase n=1 Tax=Thalassotalea sp. PP2-459 TaxID=1742724 RepID=UPI000941E58C|nr:CPBP family intramembrane glutamic endopeptidase [Thalassotalea sp. PP2-459]OKY24993.1 CAAX protease family protein [Thalassotalea sp. PP2-459]
MFSGRKNVIGSFISVYRKSQYTYCIDLAIYLSVMFLIREIYFEQHNFISNGLFWSLSTLVVAITFIRFRHVSLAKLGLFKPESFKKLLFVTVFIFAFTILSIIIFQLFKQELGFQLAPDLSNEQAESKFGKLSNNWSLFFMIIPFIWLQSALEEILDRGFLINWIEQALFNTWFSTFIAVILQAFIFGFRHSYDLSERSITVGLIGLAMGIAYVVFNRNLWPLIIAHCALNTMSMIERI